MDAREVSKGANAGLYDPKPPPAIERIAGVEGQSNFISLLAGIEAGPDTTQIMGTLGLTRSAGAIPEVLEAHYAKSTLYKLPLMSMVFMLLVRQYAPAEKEWPWMQGAVADAFMILRDGKCAGVKIRARKYRVDEQAYAAVRKVSEGIIWDIFGKARASYYRAKRSTTDSPGFRHSHHVGEQAGDFVQGWGCYVTPPRTGHDTDRALTLAISGHTDRLGYDERSDKPGPVLTLYGAEAEAHCRAYPGQTSKRPYSL
jgi:hypothetical protein